MAIEDKVEGEIKTYKGNEFLLVERGFDELDGKEIGDYIRRHGDKLTVEAIRKTFPQFERVPKKSMLFFDIETCGLGYKAPIFSIGMTHLNHKITTSCILARDYSEEKGILQYFAGLLEEHDAYFTYNGNAFDLTRLNKRMRANGLTYRGDTGTLKQALGPRHVDLKREISDLNLGLQDIKLQTLEKLLFKMVRTGDIPSAEIPKMYMDYVAGEDNEDRLVKSIEHNMADTLTLVAVLAYVCQKK